MLEYKGRIKNHPAVVPCKPNTEINLKNIRNDNKTSKRKTVIVTYDKS